MKGGEDMAFGVKGPCYDCKYLNTEERNGEKVYCEWMKAYIEPDFEGCGHHDTDDQSLKYFRKYFM